MSQTAHTLEIVLCIPGPWNSSRELIEALVAADTGYLYAGAVMMHIETGFACQAFLEAHDPAMEQAFGAAGQHWAGSAAMSRIAGHRGVVYLVARGDGSQEVCRQLMLAADALLAAGGLAVKVESAGIAHDPHTWCELCDDDSAAALHQAFVVYVRAAGEVYTCGMHNLGLRDAIVARAPDVDGAELLRVFTGYLVLEAPLIAAGQTFSVHAGAPVYRIHEDAGVDYGDASLFANPYGSWRLAPGACRASEGRPGRAHAALLAALSGALVH